MTRCIVVLTVGRSGSSAVAGALHHAGISFGRADDLMGPDRRFNPKGHFEMSSWWQADRALTEAIQAGKHALCGPHLDLINRRNVEEPVIWGVKSPFFPWTLPALIPLLPSDLRLVVLHRRFDAIVASRMRHGNGGAGISMSAALHDTECNLARLYGHCAKFSYLPQYHVQFEEVIDNPYVEMTYLLAYCLDGLDWLPSQIDKAAKWISPALVHHA